MIEDPVVKEVRDVGARLAEKCGYDIHKYFIMIKTGEKKSKAEGKTFITKEDLAVSV